MNLAENESFKKEERSSDDTGSNLGGEVKNILTELEANEEIGNVEEKHVAIIKEIAEVLERRQKDQFPALRDIPKKKLLKETAKVGKVWCKLKRTALQSLMNYFMQELLLLQIGCQ